MTIHVFSCFRWQWSCLFISEFTESFIRLLIWTESIQHPFDLPWLLKGENIFQVEYNGISTTELYLGIISTLSERCLNSFLTSFMTYFELKCTERNAFIYLQKYICREISFKTRYLSTYIHRLIIGDYGSNIFPRIWTDESPVRNTRRFSEDFPPENLRCFSTGGEPRKRRGISFGFFSRKNTRFFSGVFFTGESSELCPLGYLVKLRR